MTIAMILVVAAALALIFILRVTLSRSLQISAGTGLAQIEPIDVEAFRNLVDPAEDDYLRRRLPAAEFRAVRRERLRATAAYIQAAKPLPSRRRGDWWTMRSCCAAMPPSHLSESTLPWLGRTQAWRRHPSSTPTKS
jgi:hypothetical protein